MPSLLELVKGTVVCVVVEEILFYYSHRLFHHGSIYKYVHKIHHDFQVGLLLGKWISITLFLFFVFRLRWLLPLNMLTQ